MSVVNIIELALSAVVFALCFILRSSFLSKIKDENGEKEKKKLKKKSTFSLVGMIISAYFFVGVIMSFFKGGLGGIKIEFDMFSDRTVLFGYSFSNVTLISVAITLLVLVFGLIFKFIIVKNFKEEAGRFQDLTELMVEAIDSFCENTVGKIGKNIAPYMLTVAIYMIFSALAELFSLRAPTSDLTVTFALGLITFFLINYYGIKSKGLFGRIKSMASPVVILPMKILSDVAVPLSLGCRLFGNMLGGMIVMDLLKGVLGGFGLGITSLAGIYFNLFHPLIQTYIFAILSLTFINEAAE